jgi:hypothetical protein
VYIYILYILYYIYIYIYINKYILNVRQTRAQVRFSFFFSVQIFFKFIFFLPVEVHYQERQTRAHIEDRYVVQHPAPDIARREASYFLGGFFLKQKT